MAETTMGRTAAEIASHIAGDRDLALALERLAVEAAILAGEMIRDDRPGEVTAAATKTSDTDVVTVMDTRSEATLRAHLRRARPEDGFFGEEGTAATSQSGITWVVDPIDGTVNYLYGIPLYAVSVAAVVGDPQHAGQWAPLAGAVFAPALGTLWHAARGRGSFRRDVREAGVRDGSDGVPDQTQVGGCTDLAMGLIGTGFAYLADERARQADIVRGLLPDVRDIRRLGSAALDLCLVADGRLDGYFESGLRPWDLAAGWLVVTESGGVVRGPGGADPQAELTIAGNRSVALALAARVDRTLDGQVGPSA